MYKMYNLKCVLKVINVLFIRNKDINSHNTMNSNILRVPEYLEVFNALSKHQYLVIECRVSYC